MTLQELLIKVNRAYRANRENRDMRVVVSHGGVQVEDEITEVVEDSRTGETVFLISFKESS